MRSLKQVVESVVNESHDDDAIDEHIKNYHLHNIAWMANEKLGDHERAEYHMKQGMDHHANAVALYRHGNPDSFEPITDRLHRIKAEVHARLKDDLT